MSFWSDFVDNVKGLGKTIGGVLGAPIAKAGAQIGAGSVTKGYDPTVQAIAGVAAEQGTKKALQKAGVEFADEGKTKAIDPILRVAAAAEQYVFSPYIKRPLSTGFLLTDPNSKLYKSDEKGKGFQFSDIADAYKRSEDVSLGVAFTKSWVAGLTPVGQFERWALQKGGVDLEDVDLWDDKDVEKNFVDNPVGRWISGTNDFVIGEAAINVAFGGAGAVAKAFTKRAGLRTKYRTGDYDANADFATKIDDHLLFRNTNGEQGTYTNVGADIEAMATSDSATEIWTIAGKYTRNPRVVDYAVNTKDAALIRDYFLMDKGDFGAYQRLVAARQADKAWAISDAGKEVVNDYLLNGQVRTYTPEQRARWMQAHDDAIKNDPDLERMFNDFFDTTYDDANNLVSVNPRYLDKDYKPAEPVVGREFLGAVRSKKNQLKSAAIQRDFSNVGGVAKVVLNSKAGEPVTALMRIVGTYMPNGFVSHSGLRQAEGIQEIISTFDDIRLFTKGTKLITTRSGEQVTVSQFRDKILKEFVGIRADGDRARYLDKLNEEITYAIAYTRGFFDSEVIDTFITSLKNDIYAVHGELTTYGHAMTPNGTRVTTNAKTQQMLANSTPMLPFGKLDYMLARATRASKSGVVGGAETVAANTTAALRGIFELGNRAFSFSQLYRFSYIPKNSVFEPMLAGWFAEGSRLLSQTVATAADATIRGFDNAISRAVFKAKTNLPGSAIAETRKEIKALTDQLAMAVKYRDDRYAEFHKYFVNEDGVSPATKGRFADEIREELRDAEKIIADIEGNLNVYTVEAYSKNINELLKIPSVYTLRRRIDTLKKAGAGKYGSEIRMAEIALNKAVGDMNTLAPNLATIDKEIATAYNKIGSILDSIKPKLSDEAELLSVLDAKYAKSIATPKMKKYRTKEGEVFEFPAFSDRNFLGDGYVSEISNTNTRTIEILGRKAMASKFRSIIRNNADKITKPTDAEYFGELAFVVNNRMRGDMIVDKILAGADRPTLIAWGKTGAGRSYATSFGRDVDDIVEIIDDSIAFVNSYLPTMEAKALALKGPVTEVQLQKVLADKIDQLVPIQPLNIPYDKPSAVAQINKAFDSAFASAWRILLKPENLIRKVYGDIAHARLTTQKLKQLEASGQKVDYNTALSIRQAAAAEIVDDLRKTFYTIPRQHRALYLARMAIVFPNAAFSGFYRYTGFALRQPRRTAGFLNAYYSLYNTFSVDKYGNPVENPLDAEYLLVPGTKELGFNDGRGIILSTRATNFLANLPGPNWLIPVPMSLVYADKPDAEETVRKMVDKYLGKIPGFSYDEMFPYGIQPTADQIKGAFTPSWARDVYTAFKADPDNLQWRDSLENEAQRLNILADMGLRPQPTYKEIVEGAKALYYRKAFNKFFSIFGTSQVLGQDGVGLYEDYYSMLIENNKAKGMNDTEALKEAEKQFQAQMRVSKKVDFPMERLFVGVRDKATYFPSSQAAYGRIYNEFSGLAKVLEKFDPRVVGLLTADLPREYSSQVAKTLNDPNAKLPGGTYLNSQIKSRTEIEKDIELGRFWAAYTAKIKELNEAARRADYAGYRSVEELVEIKNEYVQTLRKASPTWYDEYMKNSSDGDSAYVFAKGLMTITQDKSSGEENRFMRKHGNTQFWVHAKAFVERRERYAKAYKDAPSGSKTAVKELWLKHLDETLDLWDPTLQRLITRYFLNDDLKETK